LASTEKQDEGRVIRWLFCRVLHTELRCGVRVTVTVARVTVTVATTPLLSDLRSASDRVNMWTMARLRTWSRGVIATVTVTQASSGDNGSEHES
jgi:hypothetical protein